jgi:hypothetical protein
VTPNPWYREPWPWLLMAGPATVVVAGLVTAGLAVTSFDGMVADDYYRQGLAVNRSLTLEKQATAMGVSAQLLFSEDRTRVRVLFEGPDARTLRLAVVHPTLAGEDQRIVLAPVGPRVFEGTMRAPRGKHVRLTLEDGEGRWRVGGDWSPREASARLAPR